MNHSVILKSFPNGISVYLEDNIPFSDLLDEIKFKFKESEKFFRNVKMAISFEGRILNEVEEKEIIDTISSTCGLNIICIIGKDDVKNQLYLKALKQVEKHDENHVAQFFRGNIKDNEILETDRSVIIIGDVYPGCAVTSPKDIIVLGGLYGEAYAGGNGESDHFVVALDMSPEKLKIGDIKYTPDKLPKWSIKSKVQPKIAYIRKNKIQMDAITKELLNEMNP